MDNLATDALKSTETDGIEKFVAAAKFGDDTHLHFDSKTFPILKYIFLDWSSRVATSQNLGTLKAIIKPFRDKLVLEFPLALLAFFILTG